jgi:hypothetical protein
MQTSVRNQSHQRIQHGLISFSVTPIAVSISYIILPDPKSFRFSHLDFTSNQEGSCTHHDLRKKQLVGVQKPKLAMPDQECIIRRKSSLSVSVSNGSLEEENLEVVWPELSTSERSKKSCRSTGGRVDACCTARLDFDIGPINDSNDAYSSSCKQDSCRLWDHIDANLSATWTLQKSSNLCSLVMKENRGSESWRDLL